MDCKVLHCSLRVTQQMHLKLSCAELPVQPCSSGINDATDKPRDSCSHALLAQFRAELFVVALRPTTKSAIFAIYPCLFGTFYSYKNVQSNNPSFTTLKNYYFK